MNNFANQTMADTVVVFLLVGSSGDLEFPADLRKIIAGGLTTL